MYKKPIFLSAALAVAALSFAASTPVPPVEISQRFPSYDQALEATFATAADAAAATCLIARLPDDAELAFCCRWDDTNPADIKKGEMMKRAGVKGSFYFVANNHPFFTSGPAPLMAMGHALGNHTSTHSHMLQVNPNAAFRSIVEGRMRLEVAAQHTVNSYVSPYGWGSNPLDPEHARRIAACIAATGHFVTQDDPIPWAGLDVGSYMPTWRFSANDSAPSRDLFVKGWNEKMPKAKASPDIPRLTLGTHAWCNDAGNALQEAWLKEFCANPAWAQLNDWEYGAYRYQAVHGKVEKTGVKGKTATFRVTRFAPQFVGDPIALSLKFTVEPTDVRAADASVVRGGRGTWRLPHAADRKLHTAIARADEKGETAVFPGLKVEVAPDEAKAVLTVRITNGTARPLARVHVAAAFPPMWSVRLDTADIPQLAAGASKVCTFKLGERPRKDYAFGTACYPVSVDFESGDTVGRLWAATTTARVEVSPTLPSTGALVWGPADATPLAGVDWAKVSVVGAVLPDAANWKTCGGNADALWNVIVRPISSHGQKGEVWRKLAKDPKQGRFVCYDFTVPADGTARLLTTTRPNYRKPFLYVNGEKVVFTGSGQSIPVKAGKNRLVLRADMSAGEWFTDTLYFAVTGADGLNTLY